MAAVACKPSMSGSCTSIKTRSKGCWSDISSQLAGFPPPLRYVPFFPAAGLPPFGRHHLGLGRPAGSAARCQELGISAYLPKPVKRSDLLAAIRVALDAPNPLEDKSPLVTVHSLRESRGRLNYRACERRTVSY